MTSIYQVIAHDYFDFESDDRTPIFMTEDIDKAISIAKSQFKILILGEENISSRPDIMKISAFVNSFEDLRQNKKRQRYKFNKNNHPVSNDYHSIYVEKIKMNEFLNTRNKTKNQECIWSPNSTDLFNIFSVTIQKIMNFDLNINISDEEISSLWNVFLKKPNLFREKKHYAVTVNAAELLLLTKEEEESNDLFELEKEKS